ncbi:polycystin-1 isoform X1 [Astyanax mexicanus]|uniref:polycystin-1 isoform X1 n=1 Tax=Astyanax mexicanus TaxID=7994 RepID=UPI0020CB0E2D|nr:polycystin-1 isoform X1 [Astyanax mexicanus]
MDIIGGHLFLFWILSTVRRCNSDEDSCPKGAVIHRDSLRCYWMPTSVFSWREARDECLRESGGDVATVEDLSTQNFILNSFQLEEPALVWLRNGIASSGSSGFQHGDCSQMVLGLGQWKNGACNQEHHFICGKEISVSLPSLDSYLIGVPLMSSVHTQSQLHTLPTLPDPGQQRVEMMLFPGLWFSHGGQVLSVDLVSQPSSQLTLAKVQILRPYCSPSHYLVPPGCSSLLNPYSCCSAEPLCNTTGACISGHYWCHLLESCLPVTRPCSPYPSSTAAPIFPLPPRHPAAPPYYHTVADMPLQIPPAAQPVHLRIALEEHHIAVYPDDIVAVQHNRPPGDLLHCVRGSDSAWRQSYLSVLGHELGGWVEAGVSDPTGGGRWVDGVVCDLRLIYEDPVHLYAVPPVLSSTQSDLRMDTATTPGSTRISEPLTPVSGLRVVYPALSKENQIHLAVNIPTLIIIKIVSGQNAVSEWSEPVSETGVPFQPSCPADMHESRAACERDTPDTWFSYAYITSSTQGQLTLNITASNTLNSQMLSIKLQVHIPVTGLSIHPHGLHRVLVDITQLFTAAVITGSSVKYSWVTDNRVQSLYTGQAYTVVFNTPAEHVLRVTAENPISSQVLEVRLLADVMSPLSDLTLLSIMDAVAVNTPNIYTLRVQQDRSVGVTIRWDFGDGSTSVNHSFSAPIEKSESDLDTQIYLQDSVHHTYRTPGDYMLRMQVENEYDHIEKAVSVKVRSPLTKVLLSSVPPVQKPNETLLLEASTVPFSLGMLYTWDFGDATLEVEGLHDKISHSFIEAGVYNVSVTADNTLSQLRAWMIVEIIETISGVQLSYNGPNELNTLTQISGRVSSGSDLRWTFDLGDGTLFKDLSRSSISHVYKTTGNYSVQVTVSNAVSRVIQSINVEIYQLAIIGITLPTDCIVNGKETHFHAVVTCNPSMLTFHWSFGDGTPLIVRKGSSTIAHTFTNPGNYSVGVTVYNQVESASNHYQTKSSVCIEALITDLHLRSSQDAVALGEKICFDASVLPTGQNYQFLWYNSSSTSVVPVNGTSHHCFIFIEEGLHEVTVMARNRVSHKTAKAAIFVQMPIPKLSIQHNGTSDVLSANQFYHFWTEPSQNNGAFEWSFGDGSPKMVGQNQSHVFTSAGRFLINASVFNAINRESAVAYVEVQAPITYVRILTNQSYAEAGKETVFNVESNAIHDVSIKFYWTVSLDSLSPPNPGKSEYRYTFSRAGVFEVKVLVQNLVSEMESSALVEVLERIEGVQITSQNFKSLSYFPTNEPITLTASIKHGSSLTYHWLASQNGRNETVEVGDGQHFKLLTNSSGIVSIKLTVANALGKVCKDITVRAVERVSGVNISTPVDVAAKGQPVNISVSVKTGSDLQYVWCLDSNCSLETSGASFILHVFKSIGVFELKVSVTNVLGSVDATKQLIVRESISGVDFEIDGQSLHSPFFVRSNSVLEFIGFVRKGSDLRWEWTVVAVPRGNAIILTNNQTFSFSFMDVGDLRVTLNVSNDISWQLISHLLTVEDAIEGLTLGASDLAICEDDPITFTPSISRGSGVSIKLESAGKNYSLNVHENLTISSLPVGNQTVKAIAKNHISSLSASVAVQVVERVNGLKMEILGILECCPKVLEALKSYNFKALVQVGSQVTYQYQWSFQEMHENGANDLRITGQNVLYSPSSNGSISVTVEASSLKGLSTFCLQSITELITVQWPVLEVKLMVCSTNRPFIDHPITLCAVVSSGSDLIFHWDFGDSEESMVKVTKLNTVDHLYKVKGRFLARVIVFNNISHVSDSLAIVVEELECIKPQVSLILKHSKIYKSRPSYFEASVDLHDCVSYKTTYLWEIFQDPTCTEKKMSLKSSIDVSTPLLYLPKHELEVGDYCLKFTTRFQGTLLEHHETTKISVVNSPLVPVIKGGSYRIWSTHNDLLLDGTESYDPDCAEQEQDDLLRFHWNITVKNSTGSHSTETFIPDQSIQLYSSILILPNHILESGRVYQFTLTVQKDGRSSVSTDQYVKMYEAEVLPVTLRCISCSSSFSLYIRNSHPIILGSHCSLCNGSIQFKWTAEDSTGDVLQLNEFTTSTGARSPDLIIRPDTLRAGSEYVFTLNVSQPNTGLWGSASITLSINSSPQAGSCTLSPEHSVQLLQDPVSFSCSGWVDGESVPAQVIYSLQVSRCEDSDPLCPVGTLYRGTQHTFSSLVPSGPTGTRDEASVITVTVQVEDMLGTRVTALRQKLRVVLPVSETGVTGWLKKKSETDLWALVQQGNPQDIIAYCTALTSQLNQLEAVSVGEFEDRVQIRGNVTQALASLSVSSLQDAARISGALALSTAVPSELQCGDCHSGVVETVKKMIKVIKEQTRQGDATPIDTGRNILNILSSFIRATQNLKDSHGSNHDSEHQSPSETSLSALQQVGELMRSLMWSRMAGEEALSLRAPQISAVGLRVDPGSDPLLCTEPSSTCQFHIPPALSSQLSRLGEEVLQVLLVLEPEGNTFISAADPPISTTLAAMEFSTPQGLTIPITNLTSDTAIRLTLHQHQDTDVQSKPNITLPSEGSVNFTVRAVEVNPQAGLFIAFNFSLIQGNEQTSSGEVNIAISDRPGFPPSQQSLDQELKISLSSDVPSMEKTIFLSPLLNGSSKDLYVTLDSRLSGLEVCVEVCVFSSLCQFFSMEERHWSTDGLSVLSSSSPNTAHCLTRHLTLFGASLFVHPDAILFLPPSDGPVRNVMVGIVCGVLLLVHLLVGLIAHKLDHLESLRRSCVPLCGRAGRHQYRVLVKTGWQRGAGTSAHVGISLFGLNKSGSRHLQRDGAFQRNGLDDFQVETDANLGEIWKICIWHDNTGLHPSWYLQHVVVWDLQTDNMFFFLVDDWLSVENEKNCGMVQKEVLATCPQELQQFNRMLREQLLFGLRDHHLWMSLWERPAHSSFSRAQRLTTCALSLHLYLAAGAVWYGAVSTKSTSGPVADQMLVNWETVLVGMTVAAVMFPLQTLLTFLFRNTKSKLVMELSLPPSPVSDTVEMDVYPSHPGLSCSSFLSMPTGRESSTQEGPSPFTESAGNPQLESEFWEASNFGNGSSVDQWTSNDSIFGLPELMGPTRLLKRKRALLKLPLASPTSELPNYEPGSSPHLKKQSPSLSEEELESVSADRFLSSTDSSGPTTSDSGRYSPNETFLSDFPDRSCSEWSELNEDNPVYEGGLYKSASSLSVCSVASTFLPSLPPDSCSTTSKTRIGVARGDPGMMLPSGVLAVVYLLVAALLGTCLAMVGLYGSRFSNSVVLMWLISALSAFLTSTLLIEPLKVCVRALYLAAVVKPVDPEVEDRLAQETVVRKMSEEQGVKVHPPCGYGLLQAKEEARKVRTLRALMRDCLVFMLFLLVVLMVNYQENVQEMNSRMLHAAVKHAIISAPRGQPNLTALTGWRDAWQWMDQSLISHLYQNPSLSLIGSSRLQRVRFRNFCGGKAEDALKYDQPSAEATTSILSYSKSELIKGKHQINNTNSLLPWSWSTAQSCSFSETEEVLLGNNSVSTRLILSELQTDHWITAETQTVLIEFTQYHRETGLFIPVSVLLENSQTHRIQSTVSIHSFHISLTHSGLDLNTALTALLLLFSLCFLITEIMGVISRGVQYLRQGWCVLQLLLMLLSLATASTRLCFLSEASACLSSHLLHPDTFTHFHRAALLSQSSSQLSAVLLTILLLQMVDALRFVRRWVVFGKVLQQICSEMCGVALLFVLLLLLFSHTGCMLFSGSVEDFRTVWRTSQSLLGLLSGRAVLHQLCEQHPVLGPLYCLCVFGLGFWMLGRLCGAVLLFTYRTFRAELHRPSIEPQDYEMVEFLIKRLKLWMGLSKAKEFRHRVKFEGMESPPSRSSQFSQFSQFSSSSMPSSPISPTGPRPASSSSSSLSSECSTLSDSPDLQQYLQQRLLPSVDNLLAGFDRVNQLTDDVLDIELQLQKFCSRMAEKRRKLKELPPSLPQPLPQSLPQPLPQMSQNLLEVPQHTSSHQDVPQILPRRRGTHSESSICLISGPVTLNTAHPGRQVWQQGPAATLEVKNFPRRRAWHSGSCHSADPTQRSPVSQNPAAVPARPRSEERERSEAREGLPIKRRAWHPEDCEMEKDQICPENTTETRVGSVD